MLLLSVSLSNGGRGSCHDKNHTSILSPYPWRVAVQGVPMVRLPAGGNAAGKMLCGPPGEGRFRCCGPRVSQGASAITIISKLLGRHRCHYTPGPSPLSSPGSHVSVLGCPAHSAGPGWTPGRLVIVSRLGHHRQHHAFQCRVGGGHGRSQSPSSASRVIIVVRLSSVCLREVWQSSSGNLEHLPSFPRQDQALLGIITNSSSSSDVFVLRASATHERGRAECMGAQHGKTPGLAASLVPGHRVTESRASLQRPPGTSESH